MLASKSRGLVQLLSHSNSLKQRWQFYFLVNQNAPICTTALKLRDINPYPPVGTTSENSSNRSGRKSHRLRKAIIAGILVGAAGTYGMVWYGREDPRFRKRMINAYPWTQPVFDFFLGDFGITPYLIPAYEIKEGVKEKLGDVKDTVTDKVVRHVPLPSFIERKLQPPVQEEVKKGTTELASGMLPNADPALFLAMDENREKRMDEVKLSLADERALDDEYSVRLLGALKHAQNHVAEAIQIKHYLIQDYAHHNVFLVNDVSMASRNEESDARRAIRHLNKVIAEGKSSKETAKNPYIRNATATANHFTKQLDQLDYLVEVAKHENDSDMDSKLIWE